MMCAMPDDMRWSIVMVITEDLDLVCESNAVGMGHMGHGAIGALAWDSALARPDARYRPSTRYGGRYDPDRICVCIGRASACAPGGDMCMAVVVASPTRRLPDRGGFASFFSSAHSRDAHTLGRAAPRFAIRHWPLPLRARDRGSVAGARGHAGPVTR